MHLSSASTRIWRRLHALAIGGAATVAAIAQSPGSPGPSVGPTFPLLAQALTQQDYSAVELRRFRDDRGNVVVVRDQLVVHSNGSNAPAFDIEFVAVVGETPRSPLTIEWQGVYRRYGRAFFENSSFHIRDVGKAQQNYTLHNFGTTSRAGRLAYRTVVFPQSLDKSIWVVDIDQVSFVPLYAAEFDSSCRFLSEVEIESITFGQVSSSAPPPPMGGAPVTHPTFSAALVFLGDPPGLVDPLVNLGGDYVLDTIVTKVDPLNARQRVVTTYTDGIDRFMIAQVPNAADVFADLHAMNKSGPIGHTIGRYRDSSVSMLLFWEGGVAFQVSGKGSLQRLDDVAKSLYLQALSSN